MARFQSSMLVSGYAGISRSSVVNELQESARPAAQPVRLGAEVRPVPNVTSRTRPWPRRSGGLGCGPSSARARRSLILVERSAGSRGPERPAYRQPRSRAGARDREAAAGRGLLAAAGRQKSPFQMVSGVSSGCSRARKEHPLALFLDDLQWLDAATSTSSST